MSAPFPEIKDQVSLLWMREVCGFYTSLSRNILREICVYLQSSASLAFFTATGLEIHSLHSHTVTQIPLKETITGCITTHMSYWEILCVGTYPKSTSVSSVDLKTYIVKQEAAMKLPRNCPGVIKAGDFVYIFGGFIGGFITRESEKFSITTRSWTKIPEMDQTRVYFTPALHLNEIYLCDASSHPSISSFNITTETYTVYSSFIPAINTNASVSFIVDGELIVALNNHSCLKWSLGSSEPCTAVSYSQRKGQGFSCTETVQVGRVVYWADYNAKKIVSFELDTLRLSITDS